MIYLAETDAPTTIAPPQSAAYTYRIAFGRRAGQKVLSLQSVPNFDAQSTEKCCVSAQGFSFPCQGAPRLESAQKTAATLPPYHPSRHRHYLDNVKRLQNGELDFVLVQGGFEFDGTGLLMLAAVDKEHLHILVPVSSDIHDLSDLAGKRIAAGVDGTGSRRLTESIVEAASYDPPVKLIATSREAVAAEMNRGEVDAAMFVSDLRRELKPLLAEGQFRLVGVKTADALSQLLFDVDATEIPSGIYGMNLSLPDAPLPTLSVQTNLVVRLDVPNNVVKQVIEALYNFRVRHDAWLPHLTEESGSNGPDLMLHPAAEAYYKRNDPLTSDQFEIAAFFLAALIALLSAVRLFWRWYRIRVITGKTNR